MRKMILIMLRENFEEAGNSHLMYCVSTRVQITEIHRLYTLLFFLLFTEK